MPVMAVNELTDQYRGCSRSWATCRDARCCGKQEWRPKEWPAAT